MVAAGFRKPGGESGSARPGFGLCAPLIRMYSEKAPGREAAPAIDRSRLYDPAVSRPLPGRNLNFAVLGFFGIALLFWTVVLLLSRVKKAFNSIWHIPGVRSWSHRFSDYLSVVLVGPMLLFAALGVTAIAFRGDNLYGLPDNELLNQLVIGLGRLVPYLLICAAFAFLYSFLTNYRVRPVPALVGGTFAGVTWYGVAYLFARLLAGSSKYSAIYSSMAAAMLFVIWIQIGWLIILVGAHIARYTQYPLLRSLREKSLIAATNDDPEVYLPARLIETISLREILDAARAIREISADIEQAITEALKGKTLKDLVLTDEPYPGPDVPSSAETRDGSGVRRTSSKSRA